MNYDNLTISSFPMSGRLTDQETLADVTSKCFMQSVAVGSDLGYPYHKPYVGMMQNISVVEVGGDSSFLKVLSLDQILFSLD